MIDTLVGGRGGKGVFFTGVGAGTGTEMGEVK